MNKLFSSLVAVAIFAVLGGLSTSVTAQTTTPDTQITRAALTNYADIVFASYQDALTGATALQQAVDTFLADRTAANFDAAKQAWLAAREPYGQTEAFRFYGGPIDAADGPEPLLNSWPLDENYIDYVDGDPTSGIINHPTDYPDISEKVLADLNQNGAEEHISVGYHAVEFLLWGQDLSADGPGQRPYTDYVAGGTAANQERRAQYLKLVTDMIVENLTALTSAWAPAQKDNYRATFLALQPDAALEDMLTGIGVLAKSELSGERMFTAYDNQDQEDEHSCFSDNTHRDLINNLQGIINVYTGSYTRIDGTVVSGTSLADVVEAAAPDLNKDILALLDSAKKQTGALYVPFDQAIIRPDSREAILNDVFTLQDVGDKFAEVAITLNLTINTALPE